MIFKIQINLEEPYNDIGLNVRSESPNEDVWLIASDAQFEIGNIVP